ncbi:MULTISPECIES: XdhC family protein [unclassified Amycolatopsis]|uniref:XdhC family protein n=1 Tax=unclassified Amycolatopsis TaxID=2618356 RepID=UPI002E0E9182|nr:MULTISPECIES: XdhC family protein [unclassified Amycolatopsis]WSJ80815.1 XdhC family protein [Amycolatopsis sp. NBC_01307]WSK75745.1 XdhC family protein [Amycolatopsis sp. NBC_01286]
MDGWDVLAEAGDRARRGEAFALATVVWREGPSSGKEGCRAIVTEDGELHGWIGGACAEPVVLREARQALAEGTPRLLLLGTPDRFGSVPDGMTVVPISCQSEGALEIYVEPVVPAPHLVVAGRSPLAHTLVALATALGWRAELSEDLASVTERSYVVVATQGHNDEETLERALTRNPAYVGLVGSRKRGEAVLGYLADRGVPADRLARVQVPAGVDLGAVEHREIAVAVLAELVRLRAAARPVRVVERVAEEAVDPVCGMTVARRDPVECDGVAYYFCCAGCRDAFRRDPAAYAKKESRC